jgi:hypothetical protein
MFMPAKKKEYLLSQFRNFPDIVPCNLCGIANVRPGLIIQVRCWIICLNQSDNIVSDIHDITNVNPPFSLKSLQVSYVKSSG